MNAALLINWYDSHSKIYAELANTCGSVSELLFRLDVIGSKWTKWDWVFFLSFLDYELDCDKCINSPCNINDINEENANSLMSDIYMEIDNGNLLDSVFTNKVIIMNMIEWARLRKYSLNGIYRILARVFRRFPKLWQMNWMFIKHKGGKRTHRLESSLQDLRRNEFYFKSDAFRQDFIYKYIECKYNGMQIPCDRG